MITINLIDIIIITMIILIQEYICWMTYINWFKNTITYCKMIESYSFIGMMLLLPILIWIPIIPIVVIYFATDKRYLTIFYKK